MLQNAKWVDGHGDQLRGMRDPFTDTDNIWRLYGNYKYYLGRAGRIIINPV